MISTSPVPVNLVGSNSPPVTVREAKAVVEDIAALNGVFSDELLQRAVGDMDIKRLIESNSNLKTIANNATHKLAEDLNDKPIHFVLECIQNADDHDYDSHVKPFLRLSISPQQIQLDCNEKGFKETHVRALCSVGKSTKSSQKATGEYVGYIGEKGIGFKSVFKVAERVYVHSPPFSFMFDKTRELGMITPVWVPEAKVESTLRDDSQTAILLLPAARETYAGLFKDFLAISSTLLLFLRKLKKLELILTNLPPESGPTSIHKTIICEMLNNRRVAILTEQDANTSKIVKEQKYYIFEQIRHTSAVEEKRREGVKKTELALAFPVGGGEPCKSSQSVHAFLPIRDYGFKFIIQADFIVTSTRQDVEQGLLWNKNLRDYVPHVFKDAIVDFVKWPNHELRYTWMRFLPTDIPQHPFWSPMKHSIQQTMRSSVVLESRAGTLHCPPDLYRVPDQMKDRFRCPIVGPDSSFLSSNYKDGDADYLEDFGVGFCSWTWFLEQLCVLGDSVPSRPAYWHEDLAKSLHNIQATTAWTKYAGSIRSLPLIPLQDGTWAAAAEIPNEPIYFRRGNGMVDVPADINLRLVDSSSSANTDREQLFRLLGVRDCNRKEVAALILRKHDDDNRVPRMHDAVAHLNYLFALDPAIRDKLDLRKLWLYDEQGNAARGLDLYVRHTTLQEYSAASLLGSESPAKFLSANYGSYNQANDRYTMSLAMRSWLQRSTGITDIPRLTKFERISPDFEFILDEFPNDVLRILKAHWATYKSKVDSLQNVKDRISSYEVPTFDGVAFKQQKLRDTFVPEPTLQEISSDLCSKSQGVSFLYLESYRPSDWDFLKAFGVKFNADLNFYYWIVRQTQFRDSCTLPKFKDLLLRIALLAKLYPSERACVCATFRYNNVFIPTSTGGKWAGSRDCVWDAPRGFQKQISIGQWYDDDEVVSTLLRSTIGINDVTVEAVINDLTSAPPSDEYLEAAFKYFVGIKGRSDSGTFEKVRKAFMEHEFLPIGGVTPSRVKSTSCFWGNPDFEGPRISLKHDLQCEYENNSTMKTLCKVVLGLRGPEWADLVRELNVSKGGNINFKHIERIYAYIFHTYPSTEKNRKIIKDQFDSDALVFLQLPSGNCWKPPSECIWQTPISLRCKFALKQQYANSAIAVINLLQSTLNIKDASIEEYISDLKLLSTKGDSSRDNVESLYKHIELQWNPEINSRNSTFGSDRIILDHKTKKWVSLHDCIWYGPSCIQLTPKLWSLYPDFKTLFTKYLGVINSTFDTFTGELSALPISDPENISAKTVTRVKGLLFAIDQHLSVNSSTKLPATNAKFLKTHRVWPRRYIGSEAVTLVDLTQPFFIPDHPLLLKLLQTKEACDVPILEMQCEELSAVKRLLLAAELEGRRLSTSKKETVSATDMSDPADDLTEDLRKRAQALFYCAAHYDTTEKQTVDDLLKKLSEIRVYRTPDISTKYEINSQGIEKNLVAKGYLRMAEENGELRVFVPDDESLRKTGYANSLATEMMRVLRIPEEKSWQVISALLTSDPDVEPLALILSLHGISHKLSQPSTSISESKQGETDETARSQPSYGGGCDVGSTAATILPATTGEDRLSAALKEPLGPTSPPQEEFGEVQSSRQCHDDLRSSIESPVLLDTDAPHMPPPSNMSTTETSHSSSSAYPNDLAAVRSRIIAEAKAADTSIFTVAPAVRDVIDTADSASTFHSSTSSFDLSNLAMTLPSAIPSTPVRNRSVENGRSTQGGGVPSSTAPTTAPAQTSRLSAAPRINSHRYQSIDIIGYEGEQFVVELLKQHLPDFQDIKHWTSKLKAYAGYEALGEVEITDLTYPDTHGFLSAFIINRAEEDKLPDWLAATICPGSKYPTYFLEVKTTTGACNTPFIISRNQLKIMEEKAVTVQGSNIPSEVYVLVRVYNINSKPQIKIYLDPWNMKDRRGGLRFAVDKYSVTPISI